MATAASPRFSSRSKPLVAAWAAAVVAALALGTWLLVRGDGGDPRRAAADQYVREVNAVQADAAIELGKIGRTYEGLRLSPAELRRREGELAEAETTLRRLTADVAAIVPPPEAERVHEELQELLRQQVALAGEMTQLARYVPRWVAATRALDAATRRLRTELGAARTARAQGAAFARYTGSVRRTTEQLAKLQAPAVLEPPRRQEIARLTRVRALAGELRDALAAGGGAEIGPLFDRLADANSTANTNRTQRAAVAAYNRRLGRLTAQRAVVETELSRLTQAIG